MENKPGQATGEPSTVEEREALRRRRRTEFRPLTLSPREVEVLDEMLSMAEAAIAGAGLKDLPK
jgi:hypothetical protein